MQGPYGYPGQQNQQHQQQSAPQQQHQQQGGFGLPNIPGMGGIGRGLPFGGGPNLAGVKQPSGLPGGVSFGLAAAAVIIALIFDIIFLHVHIPGVGGYAWYLTTALSFAGAGYGSMKWTKAGKGLSTGAVIFAAVVYGLADLGLGVAMEGLTVGSSIFLAAQGVVIALVCGFGGMTKAARESAS